MTLEGCELKRRRKALKLNQVDFAKLLGLHHHTVSQMECGTKKISDLTAAKVCKLHGGSACERPKLSDPLDQMIVEALFDAGIEFQFVDTSETGAATAFYLVGLDISLSVERTHTRRNADQMAQSANLIVAQGRTAVKFLAAAIRSGDFFELSQAKIRMKAQISRP